MKVSNLGNARVKNKLFKSVFESKGRASLIFVYIKSFRNIIEKLVDNRG